jgi:6-phospho-beta-glucosidase
VKIAVVGGGSTYTPELVDGFARMHDVLPLDEVWLVDPDEHRRDRVGGVSRRIVHSYDDPYVVQVTDDLVAGVTAADIVLLQLRVGGQAARLVDEHLPLRFGCIGQETTGPGGLAKAMRTVPVVLDVARVAAEHAPGAWIVDFTNPVGIVTRALLRAGHRAVGLCNVGIGLQRFFAGLLAVAPDRVRLDHVGLNHLTWEREVRLDGVDVLPRLLSEHAEQIAARVKLPRPVVEHLGIVPSYYLRYYYCHDAVLAEQRRTGSRAEEVARIEGRLLDMYADPSVTSKPKLLEQRGGAYYSEAAVQLAASLVGSARATHVANVRNGDSFPFLPADAVIEVPVDVTAGGLETPPLRPLEPQLAGLVADVSAYEELALEAALHGGRDRVVRALLAHPLVRQWDAATGIADRLIAENAAFLPWAR